MNKWKEYKLSELCIDVSYGYTASTLVENTGYKFLRITDIQGGNVTWNNVPYCKISEKHYSKYQLKTGDIVIARTGNSTGESYIFDENIFNGKAVFASYLIRYRIDEKIAIPYYIWLCLRTSRWWNFVFNSASGSAQKGANAKVLGNFSINLPNIQQQFRIANFFHNINRKIVLNTQTNQTLEQIAQAIFKHWFIDFAPVHAKANALARGETTEQAELAAMACLSGKTVEKITALKTQDPTTYHQLQQTAAAFPSEFVETEMGEVPKGWECLKIEQIIKKIPVGKKYSQKNTFPEGHIPVLDQGKSGIIGFHNDTAGVNASIQDPVIVFANHTCYMRLIHFDFSAIQNVFAFKGQNVNIYWLYLATLGKQKFVEYKGHFPDFLIKQIVVPPKELTEIFGNIVKDSFSKIALNLNTNEKLAKTRDLLLPKLLNKDIEL